MPAKTTQSLDDLRSQARLSYRYWPIYLYLRLREVEQHLNLTERAELAESKPNAQTQMQKLDLSILIEYGLWKEDEPVPEIDAPEARDLPQAEKYIFRVGASLGSKGFSADFSSLNLLAIQASGLLQLELLRVRNADIQNISIASKLFNRIAEDVSLEVAFEAARLWAALHGARILHWQAVPEKYQPHFLPDYLAQKQQHKALLLPARKRGKGIFREPK